MAHYNLALVGFGNVGKALAMLLIDKQAELKNRYGISFAVTGIATNRHGMAVDPNGIDLSQAILTEDLTTISAVNIPDDIFDFINASGADVLFENTPVNYQTGQPAASHLKAALEAGMHAITANKGPVVFAYTELTEFAQEMGRKFFFESAVMDGAPVFALFRETLPALKLISFRGVLNSTTNVILTRMETGESFEDAVAYTQQIGLAETDPSGDIDGWDAAVKVSALVTVLMGKPLKPSQVNRQGIRSISPESIAEAWSKGLRWKLICSARLENDHVYARVAPEKVDPLSPFYAVEGATSIVQFETDVLTQLSMIEGNPGPHTTAYGLLADFINAVR